MKPKIKRKLDLTKVHTRYEPPTLEEAIFAAQGLSTDIDHQVQIAADLMGQPLGEVKAALLRAGPGVTQVTSARIAGTQRSVIVERKGPPLSVRRQGYRS